jgi:EAL and modified HD-GYP domain-containing signal transduction protein
MVGNQRGVFRKSAAPATASRSGPAAVRLVRQPLFNADEEPVGYRLLSSTDGSGSPGGYLEAMPQGDDAEFALAEELHAIAPRRLVFLSVSRRELLEGLALSLPQDRVVLCLRAVGPIDDDLRDAVDRHAMRGFRLALDAGDLAAMDGPLLDRVRTVVVEVGAHSPDQLEHLVTSVRWRVSRRELMAASVDSRRSFELCWRLGFDVFQGQFFLRPTAGPTRSAAEAGLGGIRTMADLATTDNFGRLADIITRDPGLSMRLLRYANSAHMALPRRVGSVHEALAWLGTVAVRQFALISALANVPDARAEMLVTALTRARMCQQLSRRLPATNPEESFTVGLFSVAEAVTNAPIESVLDELPLREDITSALVRGEGELGRLLAAVIAYERGDFVPATTLTGASDLVAEVYLDSIRWADSAVNAVG